MAINLGDISFGLGPDTRRLAEARNLILQFGRDLNRVANSQSQGARALEATMRRQERAMVDASQAAANLNAQIRRVGASQGLINSTNAAFDRLTKELGAGAVSALRYQRSMEDFGVSLERTKRSLAQEKIAIQQVEKAWADAARVMQREASAMAKAEENATKTAFQMARAQEQATLKTERAYFNATRAVTAFNAAVAKAGASAGLSGRANEALNIFKGNFGNAGNSMLQQARATQTFKKSLQELQIELSKYKSRVEDVERSNLVMSMRRLADVAVLVSGPMSGLATRLSLIASVAGNVNLSTAAMVVGISGGVAAFVALGEAAISATKKVQGVTQSLDSINQNMTITQVQMADLMRFADQTGTQFDKLGKQYAQLQAASAGTNLEGEATRKIFQQLTLAGAKMQLSQEDLEGVLRAVQQIMSKGTVQAEELRGQLGDRIPGAVQYMAQALGVSTKKLGEMMKKGEVTSAALVKFADKVAEKMGIKVTDSIDTVVAAEGRLYNATLRFGDALDKTVGFSTAYQMALEGLVGTLDYLTTNMDTVVKVVGALAGGIAAAMAAIYAPAIISGIGTVITMISALTKAIWALNIATMANPFGAFAKVLAVATVAIAGAIAGYELMDKVIGDTANAHVGAIPSVRAYIRAQEDMKYTIRDTTAEYIRQQEVFLQGLKNQFEQVRQQRIAIEDQLGSETGFLYQNPLTGQAEIDTTAQANAMKQLPQLENQMKTLGLQVRQGGEDMSKLNGIMAKQTEVERKRTESLNAGTAAQTKNTSAVRNAVDAANDEIRKLQEQFAIMQLPKVQQEWAKTQMAINESIDQFRDKLVQAKVPIDIINQKVAEYSELVRKVKEGEYYLDNQVKVWDELSRVIGQGMQTAGDSLVDALMAGESAMQSLQNSAKTIVASILKSFLQLGTINPLLNSLFGGDPTTGKPYPTFGGLGGLFGSLFGGSSTFVPTTTLGGYLGLAGGSPNYSGGMTWVGEEGPEKLMLPGGSRVKPANRSRGNRGIAHVIIDVNDDRFNAYVDERADGVSRKNFAKGIPAALDQYGDTKFHDHFERHANSRRNRGGRRSNMGKG